MKIRDEDRIFYTRKVLPASNSPKGMCWDLPCPEIHPRNSGLAGAAEKAEAKAVHMPRRLLNLLFKVLLLIQRNANHCISMS